MFHRNSDGRIDIETNGHTDEQTDIQIGIKTKTMRETNVGDKNKHIKTLNKITVLKTLYTNRPTDETDMQAYTLYVPLAQTQFQELQQYTI